MPRVMELRLASCLPYLDTILPSHTTCILVEFPWHSTSLLSSIQTTSTLPYLDTIMHSHHTCSRPPMAQTLSFKYRCIFFHLLILFTSLFIPLFFYFFIYLHLKINYFTPRIHKQTKKNEPAGLVLTSRTLPKSGLKVTPLCQEVTRIYIELAIDFDAEHFPRPAAESLSLVHAHQSGAASRSCAVRVQQKGEKQGARHDEHSGRARSRKTRRENRSSLLFSRNFSSRILAHLGRCVFVTRC